MKAKEENNSNGHEESSVDMTLLGEKGVFDKEYTADPTEAFASHFEKFGHGIGPAEELLKTGSDIVELVVRARIPRNMLGPLATLQLKADCDEMIENTGKLKRSTYRRMAAVHYLSATIATEGASRREFVAALVAEQRRFAEERNGHGLFSRNRGR